MTGQATILVVEDEPALREVITHAWDEEGYRVLHADGDQVVR